MTRAPVVKSFSSTGQINVRRIARDQYAVEFLAAGVTGLEILVSAADLRLHVRDCLALLREEVAA